jgi:hypothetical protein
MSMMGDARADANVRTVVPFLSLADMQRSLRYYVDGLGFSIKQEWVIDGKVRWCWLERGRCGIDAPGISERDVTHGVLRGRWGMAYRSGLFVTIHSRCMRKSVLARSTAPSRRLATVCVSSHCLIQMGTI